MHFRMGMQWSLILPGAHILGKTKLGSMAERYI